VRVVVLLLPDDREAAEREDVFDRLRDGEDARVAMKRG